MDTGTAEIFHTHYWYFTSIIISNFISKSYSTGTRELRNNNANDSRKETTEYCHREREIINCCTIPSTRKRTNITISHSTKWKYTTTKEATTQSKAE
ncbi:hypothetical protein Q8A67_024769 [Cirrhinus molitorella]|uniref:Uncharacterized protein n=1 Tax=Cirrhinus molitorella TaxID=172907 RepID=A0AA88TAT3_9TELE|nr:hypothetical protein Q8A67_024769 [Cirrhinus molitorella]